MQGSSVLSAFGRCFAPWGGARGEAVGTQCGTTIDGGMTQECITVDLSPWGRPSGARGGIPTDFQIPPATPSVAGSNSLMTATGGGGFAAFASETTIATDGPAGIRHEEPGDQSSSLVVAVGSPLSTVPGTAMESDKGALLEVPPPLRTQSCPQGYPRGSRNVSLDLSSSVDPPLDLRPDLPLDLAPPVATSSKQSAEATTKVASAATAGGSCLEGAVSGPVPSDRAAFAQRQQQERSIDKLMRPMSDPVSDAVTVDVTVPLGVAQYVTASGTIRGTVCCTSTP